MGIMGSAKPLASLSSTLLARKGHAKPAMRPQGFGQGSLTGQFDDLGWNDMGGYAPEPHVHVQPSPAPVPPVLEQREELARQVEAPEPAAETVVASPEPDVASAPALMAPVAVSARKAARIARESADLTAKGKAAFTLRLDAERHLRLRLASAVANQSAQMLVAQALDEFLDTMPEVDALAAHLPKKKARS